MPPPMPKKALGHVLGAQSGPGTTELAIWLDMVCPFCKKIWETLRAQVLPYYEGKPLQIRFLHQVQPWHPQSSIVAEAVLACSKSDSPAGLFKYCDTLFVEQKTFFDATVWGQSRAQINERLIALHPDAQVRDKMTELLAFRPLDGTTFNNGSSVTDELKLYVKLGRQTGVHVSPTTTLNGLICDTSSSWTLEQWKSLLDPHVGSAAL